MSLQSQIILAIGAGFAAILTVAGSFFSNDAARGNRTYCHRMGAYLWVKGSEQEYKRYKKWRRIEMIGFMGAAIIEIVWLWLRTHG